MPELCKEKREEFLEELMNLCDSKNICITTHPFDGTLMVCNKTDKSFVKMVEEISNNNYLVDYSDWS